MIATVPSPRWSTWPRHCANKACLLISWFSLTRFMIFFCTGLGWRRITRPAISSIGISRLPEIEDPFVSPKTRGALADIMRRQLPRIATFFLLAVATLGATDKRINLLPKLQPGQTITYLIRFQSDKNVKTESKVVAPMAPNAAQIDAHGLLRVEILDVQQAGSKTAIHARGRFLTLDSGVWLKRPGDKKPDWDKQRVDPHGKSIDFTISPDGSVNEVKGLDTLFPEHQQAWQQWVARFALAWTLPADGMKFGEKWKSEQAEQAGAPIAGLHWARESSYVRDEPCQASHLSILGDVSASSGPPDT